PHRIRDHALKLLVGVYLVDAMRTDTRQVSSSRLLLRMVAILVVSAVAVPAKAQESPVTSQTSPAASQLAYEGQTVNSVDLVANPRMDVDPYRHLVALHPGEPYSAAKVQQTIAALRQSGAFSKVDVQVTPETNGLRVSFVLEPAYYVGVIEF